MQAAFAAALGRPAWWILALAAFLVRGGLFVILLPLVSLPTPAAVATALAPSIETLAFARQSIEGALVGAALLSIVLAVVGAAAFAGSWLDVALIREAEGADELESFAPAGRPSAWRAFGLRLAAHVPTLVALGYAVVRLVIVTYEELLSPGDPAVPIALRVIGRAPDAIVVVTVLWLLGEAVGGIAMRRLSEGATGWQALGRALRDLAGRRGIATFAATNLGVLSTIVLLVVVAGRAVDRVRTFLISGADAVSLGAALLLLVASWVLGLALLGAALAWRATAWTAETGARPVADTTVPGPLADESTAA